MGKMLIGARPPNKSPEIQSTSITAIMKPEFEALPYMEPKIETMPVLVPQIVTERVIEREISKVDKRARQHSKAVKSRLNVNSEIVKILVDKVDLVDSKISLLEHNEEAISKKLHKMEMQKPQEKQTVIESTIITEKVPKLVYIGLAISLILNVVVLVLK